MSAQTIMPDNPLYGADPGGSGVNMPTTVAPPVPPMPTGLPSSFQPTQGQSNPATVEQILALLRNGQAPSPIQPLGAASAGNTGSSIGSNIGKGIGGAAQGAAQGSSGSGCC